MTRGGAAIALWAFALGACGGSTTDTSPSTEQMIASLCDRFATDARCGSDAAGQQCSSKLSADTDNARQSGCQAQLDAYLACAQSHPIQCAAIEGEPLHPAVDSACSASLEAFNSCYTNLPGECSAFDGNGTCGIGCTGFSSRCAGPDPNGPVDCVCDTGPKAGATFTAKDCSADLLYQTGHMCR